MSLELDGGNSMEVTVHIVLISSGPVMKSMEIPSKTCCGKGNGCKRLAGGKSEDFICWQT
ncbi:hypothetical protein HanIR_Chr08g0345071 [Helianthus annuus]|nr:hypothetical protein HanIR_Chr08g0345071 [Helianthus annuus]